MFPRLSIIVFIALSTTAVLCQEVLAQQVPAEEPGSIGQLINRVDRPSAWQAPTNFNGMSSQSAQGFPQSNQVNQSTAGAPTWMAPQYPTQVQSGQMQQPPTGFSNFAGMGNPQAAQPQELMQVNGQPTLRALLPGLFNRAQAQAQAQTAQTQSQAPMGNPFTMQNMMKAFMGGGDAPKDAREALSQAREDLQTARDQSSQARGDASSVRGTSDKGSKQSYAESARYHAQSARQAADRAYNCAQSSGASSVSDIASQARGAADEAQAAADRATANASGGGW